jgi:hypothetical protein
LNRRKQRQLRKGNNQEEAVEQKETKVTKLRKKRAKSERVVTEGGKARTEAQRHGAATVKGERTEGNEGNEGRKWIDED